MIGCKNCIIVLLPFLSNYCFRTEVLTHRIWSDLVGHVRFVRPRQGFPKYWKTSFCPRAQLTGLLNESCYVTSHISAKSRLWSRIIKKSSNTILVSYTIMDAVIMAKVALRSGNCHFQGGAAPGSYPKGVFLRHFDVLQNVPGARPGQFFMIENMAGECQNHDRLRAFSPS